MLACVPLTCLLCFLSPYPTHASGSLLFLQPVSDWLAAATWFMLCALVAQMSVLLATHAGMCPSDLPVFFLIRPTLHMHLDPSYIFSM